MEFEWAENRLADFNMWAAGSGAFAGQRASLDRRLAHEHDTQIVVMNLLVLLQSCVDRCYDLGM